MRDVDFDPVMLGQDAPHLRRHVVPLRGLEIVEENQPALLEIAAQVQRFGV